MRIFVCSLEETINYVMDHYALLGCEEFTENRYCKGVLTLYVDDIVK